MEGESSNLIKLLQSTRNSYMLCCISSDFFRYKYEKVKHLLDCLQNEYHSDILHGEITTTQ